MLEGQQLPLPARGVGPLTAERVEDEVAELAALVRRYGAPILRGDFSTFEQAARVVWPHRA